ncbi:hypothetical protein DICVIV_00762 [Dictyocaulus viviparus]|uniref:Thrombospondin type 1 domain protein n=1 Tax=Dictyocaulus viviparus TaxID=29172 RepID=A0A0D8YA43_DICVI|nr:hypothetical protein DICVIV_00762 [Dictyocaulus viviparus]
MLLLIHFVFLTTFISTTETSKMRIFNCHSYNDRIYCKCLSTGRHRISLINCTSNGDWTNWSNWSPCREQPEFTQRRRRRCNGPLLVGSNCHGERTETRKCTHTNQMTTSSTSIVKQTLPEFVWGSWTEWNEWAECSCPANQRQRYRHCVGWECSGCNVQYGSCDRRCVTERWWTNWSKWIDNGAITVRFRSWCSMGANGRSLITTLVNESITTKQTKAGWSKWEIRPDVAFRYRVRSNDKSQQNDEVTPIEIQHQLIPHQSPTCVTISFSLCFSILTMIMGFTAQCLITKLFMRCQ